MNLTTFQILELLGDEGTGIKKLIWAAYPGQSFPDLTDEVLANLTAQLGKDMEYYKASFEGDERTELLETARRVHVTLMLLKNILRKT